MRLLRRRTRTEAIASIRHELALFGVDTSDLTDEQLKQRIAAFGRAMNAALLPFAEAQRNMVRMATAGLRAARS